MSPRHSVWTWAVAPPEPATCLLVSTVAASSHSPASTAPSITGSAAASGISTNDSCSTSDNVPRTPGLFQPAVVAPSVTVTSNGSVLPADTAGSSGRWTTAS